MQKPFSNVDRAVSPHLAAVDDWLGNLLGSSSANSAYARQMANGADGSNGMVTPINVGAKASSKSGSGTENGIPKVSLPPLPAYVNYQNPPGTPGVGFELPPPSQAILDFINAGYAAGGQVQQQASTTPKATNFGGSWNLTPPDSASTNKAAQPTTPGGPTAENPWGKYGNMKNYLQSSFENFAKNNTGGFNGIWNPFIGMEIGGWGGRGAPGWRKNKPDDPNNPNDPNGPNVIGLTGPGTPGAWSGTKTGWKRGGHVNDSISAALRLARGMMS